MSRRSLPAVGVLVAVFVGGALVGAGASRELVQPEAELSSEALEVIEESYFREPDADALEGASVKGMIGDLRRRYEDRFSHYFSPDAFERFREVTRGRFSGVGLSVTEVERGLRVSRVFEGSPAERAGIREADIVTAVNGKSIAGEDAELATGEIKGEPGTEVTLTVLRPSTDKSRDLELTRADLEVPVVQGELREAGGRKVAHVELLGFTQGAHAQLRDEVQRLYGEGADGLLLDLRGNGGGLLTEAILTSSVFVEDGVIVSTEGRTQPRETFEATGDALSPRPMVVLVNGDTASAAEILAAAVRDAGLAKVVGEKTFGKGVFQEVIELDNGGALDLTVGEYLTRDGDSLAGDGIPPEAPARDRPATPADEALRPALVELAAQLRLGNPTERPLSE